MKNKAKALRREAVAKDEMIAQLRVQVRKVEKVYISEWAGLVGWGFEDRIYV